MGDAHDEDEMNALITEIRFDIGVLNATPQDLHRIWPFAQGPRASVIAQASLSLFYLERKEFALARSFYQRAATTYPAFHLQIAAVMIAELGDPWTKEDIEAEFVKGMRNDLIDDVPVEEIRTSLRETRIDLCNLFTVICNGCNTAFRYHKLKPCKPCSKQVYKPRNTPLYCSRECQKAHWHASHKQNCCVGVKYRCSFCKKISSEEIDPCEMCDGPRYCSSECAEKDLPSHEKICERDLKFFCSFCHKTCAEKLRFCPCDPRMFRYCSRECQKVDWVTDHRENCPERRSKR